MIDKSQPGLWIYADGREVIQKNAAGRNLMQKRWELAWDNSKGICCLCGEWIPRLLASLEHKISKGGGKHDDRQSNLAISHLHGNQAKGSMSLEQYLKLPLDVRMRNCISNQA
jgi:hypothetical protein